MTWRGYGWNSGIRRQFEVLLELRGGQGGLLDRVQFVTSRGRESKAYGGAGGQNFSFKASWEFSVGRRMSENWLELGRRARAR